jgi:hypothetical protein
MSVLVSLFLCMTLIYFSYSAISYKVVLADIGGMFLSSSFTHHLHTRVRHEHNPLIQLKDDFIMSFVFVHKLEARVLHEHDPLILWYISRSSCIPLYA